MNAYATLGLPVRLALHPEEIDAAFREAGKSRHPDAGGDQAAFGELRAARETLASPAARLAHWLEIHGHTPDPRGVIGAEIMDRFGEVGEATQRAEGIARRRRAATTALGLAMLEAETLRARESVEMMIASVESAVESQTRDFATWEADPQTVDPEAAAAVMRGLRFLEKWKRGLMAAYAGLA